MKSQMTHKNTGQQMQPNATNANTQTQKHPNKQTNKQTNKQANK